MLMSPHESCISSSIPSFYTTILTILICFHLQRPFEVFFAVCIISNAVFLGVEVEYYVQNPGTKAKDLVDISAEDFSLLWPFDVF